MFSIVTTAVILLSAPPAIGSEEPVGPTADTIRFRLAWEVASGAHPAGDSLGELSGVAVDGWGNVYVSDFSAARLWIFSSAGEFIGPLGRKGQGPGEFRAPTGIAIDRNGYLYVRDTYRITRYRPDSIRRRTTQLDETFLGPPNADWRSTRATRFDRAGRLYYPGHRWQGDGTATRFYLRFVPGRRDVDTLFVPRYSNEPQLTAHVRTSERGGRMLPGLSGLPFASRPVWDVTIAGNLISGDGKTYTLQETDSAGRVVRTLRRTVAMERIPSREIQESTAALEHRLDSIAAFLDRVQGMPEEVRERRIPTTFPAYMAVYTPPDGSVWVRRWPVNGRRETIFDVFSATGVFSSTVVLPRVIALEPMPVLSLGTVVAAAINSETGENSLMRFARAGDGKERPDTR